ncbi:cytochrome p450 [Pochonia chlamydosporia 170]|uniref:Cytochrome p450 n=1 Tax=Pochonia chlamydosporia 170 TaxID=1380566 RepID=A0A179EZQ7_METCM|nr:cytochrome p450 [Pochonia chlamydosporia 170]OAQ58687.1 cytochrome p450 [Pochonia chlamydosporia 170]
MSNLYFIIELGCQPAAGLSILAALIACLVWRSVSGVNELNAPILHDDSGDFHKIMAKRYKEHRNILYKIPTSHKPMVIVPAHLLNDLKTPPESAISFRLEMFDRYLGKYTAVASNTEAMIHSVKVDFTRGMNHVLPIVQEELIFATEQCLESTNGCEEGWFQTPVYAAATQMIALISGESLSACLCPEAKNDSFVGAAEMWKYPSWSWPIMQYIVPQTRRIRYYRSRVAQMLKPIIESRLSQMQDPDFKKPADMIQWLIDNSNGNGHNLALQANEHIVVNIAAIHTTGGQLAHTLYDLARCPEYIPILQEEIDRVLAEEGGTGAMTKQTLFKLKKMDSFLKEVQRVNPPSMVSTNRKVLKPIKLSNGIELPVGTSLAASAGCVSKDENIWPEPQKFDGLRFFKLREVHGDEKHQFTSANQESLSFGHGRHACPGRFFAAAELKVLLVQILQNYEISLCKGYSRDRPLNFHAEILAVQDHTYELRFRRLTID